MLRFIALVMIVVSLPVSAQQPVWYVLAREDGCIDLKILAKAEKLSRAPISPEDFAQMMRQRGERVVVGPPKALPADLVGQVVQVSMGDSKAPVFVKEEVCRKMAK